MSQETDPTIRQRRDIPTPTASEVRAAVEENPTEGRLDRATGKKRRIGMMAIATGGIGLVLGGGALAMNALSDSKTDETPQNPGVEAPVQVPVEEDPLTGDEYQEQIEAKESFDAFIGSFDISAETHTDPADITAAYVDNYEAYLNSGLTVENNQNELMVGDVDKTVSNVKDKFDGPIFDKMFTDSETAQGLKANIQADARNGVISAYWISQSRSDEVPYKVSYDLLNVVTPVSTTEGIDNFTVQADIQLKDNGNENIAPYRADQGEPGQIDAIRHENIVFTLDKTSNTWKVDSVTFFAETEDNSK